MPRNTCSVSASLSRIEYLPYQITGAELGYAFFILPKLVRGYAVLANSSYLVNHYLITKITDENDQVLSTARPKVVCASCDLLVSTARQYAEIGSVVERQYGKCGRLYVSTTLTQYGANAVAETCFTGAGGSGRGAAVYPTLVN